MGLTAVSAVAISVEFCVLIGVFLSFVLYVPRAARVHMTELVLTPERVIRERISTDVPCGRIRIFSLEGELFFGAAPELEEHFDRIRRLAQEGIRVVVLRLKRARNPDAVCLSVLERFIDRMESWASPCCSAACGPTSCEIIESSGLARRLGRKCSSSRRPAPSGPARSRPSAWPTNSSKATSAPLPPLCRKPGGQRGLVLHDLRGQGPGIRGQEREKPSRFLLTPDP